MVKAWEAGEDAFPLENSPLVKDSRTEARICAVQALFQAKARGQDVADVAAEFAGARLKRRKADKKMFDAITAEAARGAERHAALIGANLLEEWPMDRLDAVHYALLWAATAELFARADVTPPVVINEFVNIAKGFVASPEEVAFVNATLDKIARAVRGEFFVKA
ncbi:MAG TPA: transcription antitermination factor NusB [Alphaproteobacteria bacterium]|nr:transcription antitermination factor NusB [Alphaproteobacteria bacterium]